MAQRGHRRDLVSITLEDGTASSLSPKSRTYNHGAEER